MGRIHANTEFKCGFTNKIVSFYATKNRQRKLVPEVCLLSSRQIRGGQCSISRCIFNGGGTKYLSNKGIIMPGWQL